MWPTSSWFIDAASYQAWTQCVDAEAEPLRLPDSAAAERLPGSDPVMAPSEAGRRLEGLALPPKRRWIAAVTRSFR